MTDDHAEPAVRHPNERRFEEFFVRDNYVQLKNYLYNYRERCRAINRTLSREDVEMVLEVGSGLSPIVTGSDRVIYSELSHRALSTLKRLNDSRGFYVVADGTRLPFRDGALSHVVCSEVLEHVENDQAAIDELGRVLRAGGLACITVPHRMMYFAADDRFVRHFRRYEIPEMESKVENAGLRLRAATKVLGPLEKVTMFSVVMTFSALDSVFGRGRAAEGSPDQRTPWLLHLIRPVFKWSHRAYALLARVDAALWPRRLATVVLFEAEKPRPSQ